MSCLLQLHHFREGHSLDVRLVSPCYACFVPALRQGLGLDVKPFLSFQYALVTKKVCVGVGVVTGKIPVLSVCLFWHLFVVTDL